MTKHKFEKVSQRTVSTQRIFKKPRKSIVGPYFSGTITSKINLQKVVAGEHFIKARSAETFSDYNIEKTIEKSEFDGGLVVLADMLEGNKKNHTFISSSYFLVFVSVLNSFTKKDKKNNESFFLVGKQLKRCKKHY